MSMFSKSVHRLHAASAATHTQGQRGSRRACRRKEVRPQLVVEPLEARCLLACTGLELTQRTIDGHCNNLAHPEFGSVNVQLVRKAPAAYADGLSAPAGANRPSPREISNRIVAHPDPAEEIHNNRLMSDFIYVFGQFLDHDLDLTTGRSPGGAPFNVAVPRCDPFFDPACTGTKVIRLNRSTFDPATGTTNPRQQINEITAFIDGSVVYGSDTARANALRTFSGGRLLTQPGPDGDLMPFNTFGLPNANDAHLVPDNQLFIGGDVRANENIELMAMHTLFVREHNRLAAQIQTANPGWTDEMIYQKARKLIGAKLQVITYKEFVPALLGPNALAPYTGYKANVNAGIANEFSTASFRVGHSLLGDDIRFLDNAGLPVRADIRLAEAFFDPRFYTDPARNGDISSVLKYVGSDNASEVDTIIVDSVRNFLFGPPGSGGFDLASLNMQRGREHGLADYNSVRIAYGLPRVNSFAQITSDNGLQRKLRDLYGSVYNIDLWPGGLAEDHIPGTSTGPTIRAVLKDQFERVRDGDRFWYQNGQFTAAELADLENTTLAQIIRDNTTNNNLQNNIFFFRFSISGVVFQDSNGNGIRDPDEGVLGGRDVQLEDRDTGAILATKKTDSNGRYSFDNFDDLETGRFRVRMIPKPGWVVTTPNPVTTDITRGDQFLTVNFGNDRGAAPGGGFGDDFLVNALMPVSTEAVLVASATTPVASVPAGQPVRDEPLPTVLAQEGAVSLRSGALTDAAWDELARTLAVDELFAVL